MRENVYPFVLSCSSLQLLQALAYIVAPLDQSNPGEQMYHFVGGVTEPPHFGSCSPNCYFPSFIAKGDDCHIPVTGPKPANLEAALAMMRQAHADRTGKRKRTSAWQKIILAARRLYPF
jgi:hypothetical protein